MARHRKDYSGERFTEHVNIPLTPSQRATLEQGAAKAGTGIAQHARELCLRRSAAAQIVAGTRRDPQALALMNELTAIGNNLNQLARASNTDRAAPQFHELKSTTDLLKAALARVLAL